MLRSDDSEQIGDALIAIGKGSLREWGEPRTDYQAQLLQFEDQVWRFLEHPDDDVRKCAVQVLGGYWGLPSFRDRAEEISRTDPDELVRSSALSYWTGYFKNSDDKAVLRALYERLRNPQENFFVRVTALEGIFEVGGGDDPYKESSRLVRLASNDALNDEIPWERVEAIVNG